MRSGLAVLVLAVVTLAGCIAETDPTTPAGQTGGNGADVPAEIAWADVATATVRPGASLGGYCTFNWVFTDAAGTVYIGTAGHCTDEIGEQVALGSEDPDTNALGFVVYDSDVTDDADPLVDFTLIQVHAGRLGEVNPTMLGQAAPSGTLGPGDASAGDLVAIYGHGMVLGDNEETRPRQGVLLFADDKEYVADMPAVPGDSGAPVLHVASGKALGVISRFNLDGLPPSTDIGPTMPFILSELEKAGYFVDVAVAG